MCVNDRTQDGKKHEVLPFVIYNSHKNRQLRPVINVKNRQAGELFVDSAPAAIIHSFTWSGSARDSLPMNSRKQENLELPPASFSLLLLPEGMVGVCWGGISPGLPTLIN